MTPFERSVLMLRDEGWSLPDIACWFDLPVFTVRAIVTRHDPPDRGQTFLIPPRNGNGVNLSRRDIPNPWFEKRGMK